MKKKNQNQQLHQLDLTDFCGADNADEISEDGLNTLMRHAHRMASDGWGFVCCVRNEENPFVMDLHYKRTIE